MQNGYISSQGYPVEDWEEEPCIEPESEAERAGLTPFRKARTGLSLSSQMAMAVCCKASAQTSKCTMYSGHVQDLMRLVAPMAEFVPMGSLTDDERSANPVVAFSALAKDHAFDEISDDAYDLILKATESLGELWENRSSATTLQIAKNALLRSVLEDDWLREEAFRRTRERLNSSYQAFASTKTSLFPKS